MRTVDQFVTFIEKHNRDFRNYQPWIRLINQDDKIASSYRLFRSVRQGWNVEETA